MHMLHVSRAMWRSEDNMRESVLSFYLSWAPGTEFGSSDLCGKDPYLLRRLASHTQGMFTLYIEVRNNKYLSFHIIMLRVWSFCIYALWEDILFRGSLLIVLPFSTKIQVEENFLEHIDHVAEWLKVKPI